MQKRAEPDELSVGDYVAWDSSGGEAYGQIERIERDGQINVPDSDFTVSGTEEDPAALIMVYREGEEGWSPSGVRVGHRFSTLTKVTARGYKGKDENRHIKRIEESEGENSGLHPIRVGPDRLEGAADPRLVHGSGFRFACLRLGD
jgi:hypothetical protein